MAIENFGEIPTYFEANKDNEEVKNYIKGLITVDRVTNFLEGDEGKKLLQPKLDIYHTKGLETWKTNNLTKLVDDEVKKKYPDQDPKDKALIDLQSQLDKMQKDSLKKELTNKALKTAQEKKLPSELIDFLIGDDEVSTTNNIDTLSKIFLAHDEALKTELLKNNSYIPPKTEVKNNGEKNPWSKEFENLSEQGKIYRDDPELAKRLIASAIK